MYYPQFMDDIELKNVRNRYDLIIVAAKRSRQLRDGSLPLIDIASEKETVIALQEVLRGKIVPLSVPRQKEDDLKKE